MSEENTCWVCLDVGSAEDALLQPCKCPRFAHSACLARWQLQSAGKQEEKTCRFCDEMLPDWRPAMTPQNHVPVTPRMRVSYGGKSFKVRVNPGPNGLKEFEEEVRQLLKLPVNQDFDVIFHCRAPGSGDMLQLHGSSAFDAAVHCASMTSSQSSVAKRHHMIKQKAGNIMKTMLKNIGTHLRNLRRPPVATTQ